MTKRCTLKEAFVEKLLDMYQPDWRKGEDITAETKRKIKDYVTAKMPEGLKEEAQCITDYTIWHMAKKIRQRENLSEPRRSNRGNRGKVSECEPREDDEPAACDSVMEAVRKLLDKFGLCAVMAAIERFQNETSAIPEREDGRISSMDTSSGTKFPLNFDTIRKQVSESG
jgi:hypothetical protein